MITSVEIENLRGVRHGKLEGLGPLTILTGPNGGGKSTVLDALLIGASPDPGDAVGRAVRRRVTTLGGAQWLFERGSRKARLTLRDDGGSRWTRDLEFLDRATEELEEELLRRRSPAPFSMIRLQEDLYADNAASTSTGFGFDNQYVAEGEGSGKTTVRFLRLVDPGRPIPLHDSFSAADLAGRVAEVEELVRDLVEGLRSLKVLTAHSRPFLAISTENGSLPVGLAGDGIQAFVQTAIEMAVAPGGLVLLEEPEVYQHPKAIWQTACALLVNMRRGVQIVLTTHSLELIDALIGEATDQDIEKMVVLNMGLEDGELRYGRRHGEAITFARQTLENDLR